MQRRKDRDWVIFYLLVYFPNANNSWGHTRVKPGTWNSIQVLDVSGNIRTFSQAQQETRLEAGPWPKAGTVQCNTGVWRNSPTYCSTTHTFHSAILLNYSGPYTCAMSEKSIHVWYISVCFGLVWDSKWQNIIAANMRRQDIGFLVSALTSFYILHGAVHFVFVL